MAADRRRLTPAADGARIGVAFALVVLLPLLAWVFATGMQTLGTLSDNTAFTLNTVRMITLVLALSMPVCLPWFADCARWSDTLSGPLLVAMVPLPLVTVLWLTGDLNPWKLVLPLVAVAGIMAVLCAGLRLLHTALRPAADLTLPHAAVTVTAAGVAWALRDTWLAWLGL
jgi:hypothetical protein